jgi:predicted adenylyl cyclase CyaB
MWQTFLTSVFVQPFQNVIFRFVIRSIAQSGEDDGHLEIERKFSLAGMNREAVVKRIEEAQFTYWCCSDMIDWFLPTKETGELMRIRREKISDEVVHTLTVKQWVATADGGKERKETERTISSLVAVMLLSTSKFLNGAQLSSLKKVRDVYRGSINGRNAVVSLDDTSDLGKFSGTYLEVEVIAGEHEDPKPIEAGIKELVSRIAGEAEPVTQSYRELMELSKK